jgi:formate dehydrogenase subunit gamma
MTPHDLVPAVRSSEPEPEPELVRFDRVERAVHWTTAGLVFVLMATGAALYAGPISVIVGRRELVRLVHVLAGLALPVPFLFGWVRSGRFRRDVANLGRWIPDDRRWLRRRRRGNVRLGKFNAGQKLNATFLAAAGLVMLGTGIILRWPPLVTLDGRTGATFVHDWFALGIWFAVGGHVFFALRDPEALRSMARGTVSARWARTERPRWYQDETAVSAPGPGDSVDRLDDDAQRSPLDRPS